MISMKVLKEIKLEKCFVSLYLPWIVHLFLGVYLFKQDNFSHDYQISMLQCSEKTDNYKFQKAIE